MNETRLRELLERLSSGDASVDEALVSLRDLPYSDLGYANVDHHRAIRQGVSEVILGQGKTPEQIVGISTELAKHGHNVLVTRIAPDAAATLLAAFPSAKYELLGRTVAIEVTPIPTLDVAPALLVSAGTSDLPVVMECSETMRVLGVPHERLFDVGVAGIHRLLNRRDVLERSSLAIVVAGMEGALASVVGGLVDIPVIAVPTSVGYGAAFAGVAALLGMLTSCASGITVVNIDNGFGAAFAAARILRAQAKAKAR